MMHLIQTLCQMLKEGQPVVLATILSHQGSTPRGSGARMLMLPNGAIVDTIGGGKVEAEVIRTAAGLFDAPVARIESFELRNEADPDDLDVICGGRMTVLVEHIAATTANATVFKEIRAALQQNRPSLTVATLQTDGDVVHVGQRCLLQSHGRWTDRCPYPGADMGCLADQARGLRVPMITDVHHRAYLMDPYYTAGTAYIFGAGHVAAQVAPLCRRVDFRTVVLDDRADFANSKRFPTADRIQVLNAFETAMQELVLGADSYVLILTRGHRHDQTVLAQALKTEAGYIGMIGSRKKRNAIYSNLRSQGFGQADIDRVHCPIGLDIGAETPAEIAVSIVAQMIHNRARKTEG